MGPGRAGTGEAERERVAENATGEPVALDVVVPPSRTGDIAVEPAGTARPVPQDPPRLSAAPSVDADRAFDALARAQLVALSKGNGGGLAGSGSGHGGIGVGLSTELSGRYVENSPVVSAPVIIEARPVECELSDTLNLRASVRVLVTRDGTPAVPRLLRSSGHESFDRCALAYVLAIRFAPATNSRAEPLDVWMNVQVAPVTTNQVGSAM